MKFPNILHKGILDEIIRRGVLEFIKHEKDAHKEEEQDSENDASILSSDKEEGEGRESEDEDD